MDLLCRRQAPLLTILSSGPSGSSCEQESTEAKGGLPSGLGCSGDFFIADRGDTVATEHGKLAMHNCKRPIAWFRFAPCRGLAIFCYNVIVPPAGVGVHLNPGRLRATCYVITTSCQGQG
jgi:hypothetical protein